MTEVMAQDDTVTFNTTTPHFQLLPMSRLTSPNYAFMRRRLTVSEKSKNSRRWVNDLQRYNSCIRDV